MGTRGSIGRGWERNGYGESTGFMALECYFEMLPIQERHSDDLLGIPWNEGLERWKQVARTTVISSTSESHIHARVLRLQGSSATSVRNRVSSMSKVILYLTFLGD
jgi:hypothetical protein